MHIELVGTWKPSFSFWYSTDSQHVRHLLPSGFELCTNRGKAFWNVILTRMIRMRPAGLPSWCGIDCWFITYSLYVLAKGEASGNVRGLYVAGCQAEPKYISRLQNVMPGLHFQPVGISVELQEWMLNLKIKSEGDLDLLEIDSTVAAGAFESPTLGSYSQALDFLKDRRRYIASNGEFIEFSDLTNQNEKRIVGISGRWKFLSDLQQNSLRLELATRAEPADFHWVFGRRERQATSSALSTLEYAEIR